LGSVEVSEVSKVGGIQKTHVLWQAVFLTALLLTLGGSTTKNLTLLAYNTTRYAG